MDEERDVQNNGRNKKGVMMSDGRQGGVDGGIKGWMYGVKDGVKKGKMNGGLE